MNVWMHVYELAVRTACTIVRAAQSIYYAEPLVAQRKHRVGGEIPSLAKLKVNKVGIFYGIVWNGIIEESCSSFRSTLMCTT